MTSMLMNFTKSGGGGPAIGILTGKWSVTPTGSQTISWSDGNVWRLLDAPSPAIFSDPLREHAGPFVDPKHFEGRHSWAGIRVIAEDPPHVLKLVGFNENFPRSTDPTVMTQGFFLRGSCTDPHMSQIHFDFSPAGGPAQLTGVHRPGTDTITWPDGNAWAKTAPSAKMLATARQEAWQPAVGGGSSAALVGALVGVVALVGAGRRLLVLRHNQAAATVPYAHVSEEHREASLDEATPS